MTFPTSTAAAVPGLAASTLATPTEAVQRRRIAQTAQDFETSFLSVMIGQMFTDLDTEGPFSGGAGETAFRLAFFALPMALVLTPLFGIQAPVGDGWWQFSVLFVLAFLINAELNLLAGTCTFWLEDITGLMSLKRNLMMLLSGLLVPLHLLPWGLGDVCAWLPFSLISYYPSMAWVGHLGEGNAPGFATILALALAWAVGLRLLNVALWWRARERMEVQGG